MPNAADQVLTAAQMRAAEMALIDGDTSVEELMQRAGQGAAEWVWRICGGRTVTVLCGPGNNGGDGWVIAEAIRQLGGDVAVFTAADPATPAAQHARSAYSGTVLDASANRSGEVLVDCLFGTGLTRPLIPEHHALLTRLAAAHDKRVAIDLPSGIDTDLGQPLNRDLPDYDITIALGAWKPAHFLMPAAAAMGTLRVVEIGIGAVEGAACVVTPPLLSAPAADAHKYTRGLLGVVAGAMPGAALLAARSAQGAGAGYVRIYAEDPIDAPADLVVDRQSLAEALLDGRISALLIGPGLGRGGEARERLAIALSEQRPAVLDADALVLLGPRLLAEHKAPLIATPHDGELFALERAFGLDAAGSKVERAVALAKAANMLVVAKGPDSVIAAPDGRLAFAPRASSWLSTAGTGDVLAGAIASRLACGTEPFVAACQGLWLHAEAARLCRPPFTAGRLAETVRSAYAACL
ncbi:MULTISPECIES: NAD(P)H-hydrate dehydratase [unclassified Novosphingobium]|uniref:NAD(P)H-hydrate dehydratase n=1 Tax=unclassified Novosphingobium TaxID=2644732 RepID=UPI000EB81CA0|nr:MULTISPECIES: NAD(P)H-hydrate dehydratase [unclassified Novosphingobium]HCF24997.1 bifunctional ADP-dependent NAD(P)H-hydrate dehydratase/NAD(P)H-hydrate epimerase [Novosphingobium sp.]HQV03643.1 NAD(P)H-hydrate dehydratase [Novosphingobium sp.]